jgi:hypothetical protein
MQRGASLLRIPAKENRILRFKRYHNMHLNDLVAYADFECLLPKDCNKKTCQKCNLIRCKCDVSSTIIESNHIAFCYHFVIIYKGVEVLYETSFIGENAGRDFLKMLVEIQSEIEAIFDKKTPMNPLTKMQKKKSDEEKYCYLCDGPLCREKTDNGEERIHLDHDHATGGKQFLV